MNDNNSGAVLRALQQISDLSSYYAFAKAFWLSRVLDIYGLVVNKAVQGTLAHEGLLYFRR